MALSGNTIVGVSIKDLLALLLFIVGVGITIGEFKSAINEVEELRTSIHTLDANIRSLENNISIQAVGNAKELGIVQGKLEAMETKPNPK